MSLQPDPPLPVPALPLGDVSPRPAAMPRSARFLYDLGLTRAALGENDEAIAAFREAVALRPDMRSAWGRLADLLKGQGDMAGSQAALAAQAGCAGDDAADTRAGKSQATAKLEAAERKLREGLGQAPAELAELMLRERLREAPADVVAMRMLAGLFMGRGQTPHAERLLARALDLAPGFAAARHSYAVALFRQGKGALALPHIERLLASEPRHLGYRVLQASTLASIGEFGRAIALYETIIGGSAKHPDIWLSYGHALRHAGKRAGSAAAYRRCLALGPATGEAWWGLAMLDAGGLSDADTATLRTHLANARLAVEDRFHLHYALGHVLEQQGAYGESFAQYAEGARSRRRQVSYSAEENSARTHRSVALFTPAFFHARAGSGCQDPAPIFIIGLPRAGSTLIEQILASHSAVEGTHELPEILYFARDLEHRLGGGDPSSYPDCLARLDPEEIAALGALYIERTRVYRKTDRPYFIDKMPNNWEHAGLIQTILPRAKIIDARRDPIANCFGAFKRYFALGQNFSYDLGELGRYYTDYARAMAHFDAVLPGRIYRVTYETLVTETEAEIRRLLAFCGLDFEAACLRFWETQRGVSTASSEQVRRPIFREGLEQWRNFEPWLEPLRTILG